MFESLAVVLFVPVVEAPLLGVIAFVRTKRIDALERAVASLEEQVAGVALLYAAG